MEQITCLECQHYDSSQRRNVGIQPHQVQFPSLCTKGLKPKNIWSQSSCESFQLREIDVVHCSDCTYFRPFPNEISEFAGICGAGGEPITVTGKTNCPSFESYILATVSKPEKPRIIFNVKDGTFDLLE
jgi:hypothetical protein